MSEMKCIENEMGFKRAHLVLWAPALDVSLRCILFSSGTHSDSRDFRSLHSYIRLLFNSFLRVYGYWVQSAGGEQPCSALEHVQVMFQSLTVAIIKVSWAWCPAKSILTRIVALIYLQISEFALT